MTTAATVVAMIPLLIVGGAGAASRFNIGVVIAAGMTIGTLFTLFVTPAVYTYIARDRQRSREHKAVVPEEIALAAAPVEPLREPRIEAQAGVLEPSEGDAPTDVEADMGARMAPEAQEYPSPEAEAFSSAASAAKGAKDRTQRAAKRPPKRRRFPSAAE